MRRIVCRLTTAGEPALRWKRSVQRQTTRLILLGELFGEEATRAAMAEVIATGHVGAEYIEYVLRHKKGPRAVGCVAAPRRSRA
jgi:hypothetical protein